VHETFKNHFRAQKQAKSVRETLLLRWKQLFHVFAKQMCYSRYLAV